MVPFLVPLPVPIGFLPPTGTTECETVNAIRLVTAPWVSQLSLRTPHYSPLGITSILSEYVLIAFHASPALNIFLRICNNGGLVPVLLSSRCSAHNVQLTNLEFVFATNVTSSKTLSKKNKYWN